VDDRVIGIAGSAGSLEPLLKILAPLPANFGAAIVFMQHQAPRTPSVLPEVIANAIKLPAHLVSDGMSLEPGYVYVCPPDAQILLEGTRLRLVRFIEGATPRNTIDAFFSSLAHEVDGTMAGILLSGLSSDGTMGLRLLKEAGGITLVQDPSTARCDVMPRSAEMAGVADLLLKPEAIASELIQLVKHHAMKLQKKGKKPSSKGASSGNTDEHMPRIFSLLRIASGVDFTYYKQPTIRRRLHRRMVLHRIPTLEKYVQHLLDHPQEVAALYQDILIHVTHFFRDPESFEVVISKLRERIDEIQQHESPIRVWVPGCSTGEEAYSIAMAILEAMRDDVSTIPLQVFATDVSEAAIEHARAGIYPESIVSDISPERLRRFFTKVDGKYRIAKHVRDTCIFARQDLTRDPPFSKLDLIMCRNVLIYLGPVLQKRLINVFHYALKPTGFLMLGAAESVGPHAELFTIADKRHKIYTKKHGASKAGVSFQSGEPQARNQAQAAPVEPRAGSFIINEANRIILARFSPPGVIVDNELKIVQFRGQTGPYLEPAPGDASFNLLKMAREGLLHALRAAIHEARKNEIEARREDVHFKTDVGIGDVTISVTPLGVDSADGQHFLVLFEKPSRHVVPAGKPALVKKGRPAREELRVAHLQQEIAASREYLQSIIQDLEAANEELQSANEEILSSNEELQSTNEELDTAKEELQSTNEELNTVNDELHGRNEELMRVNSDLVNLLASVHIAIVMVALDLRIRRFTPMAEKVLNLIPTDVGRPISDIKPNIDCPELEQLIAESIDTVTIKEREVRDRAGNVYNLRIRPYKNVENRIDGAVLALFEGPVKREG